MSQAIAPPTPSPSPFTRTQLHVVIILWLSGILAGMQFSKVSVAFQALQVYYGATPATMGWILSTVGTVGLVFGVTAGLCAPALGYKRMVLMGLGLGAALAFLQSLMPTLPVLWVTRLLEGVSHLAVVIAAPTLIIQNCEPRHRPIAMGLWSTFVSVAFALTASGGGWVLAHYQIHGLLLGHAGGLALMFLVVFVGVPADSTTRPPWPALDTLPRLHAQLYSRWSTALPGLCFFCYTSTAIALFTFLPQTAGTDLPWLAPAMPLLTIAGAFSAGWLAHYMGGPLRLLRGAFSAVVLVAMCLGIALTMRWAITATTLLLTYLLGLSGGLSYASIPHLNHRPGFQAKAAGAVAQLGNLGSTLGPPLFGILISWMGALGVVVPLLCFALLGCGLATAGIRRVNMEPQ